PRSRRLPRARSAAIASSADLRERRDQPRVLLGPPRRDPNMARQLERRRVAHKNAAAKQGQPRRATVADMHEHVMSRRWNRPPADANELGNEFRLCTSELLQRSPQMIGIAERRESRRLRDRTHAPWRLSRGESVDPLRGPDGVAEPD